MGNAAWEIPGFSFSLPANADYSAEATYLFTPVRVLAATGSGISQPQAVAPVASTGDPIIGVLQNNPQLAEAATIVQNGISKALVKEAVSIGDKLMAAPSGGFQKATTGNYQTAIALDAGGPTQYVPVLLVNLGKL
jgi:hypothetical protein